MIPDLLPLAVLIGAALLVACPGRADGPSSRELGFRLADGFELASQGHAAGSFIPLADGRLMRLSSEDGGTVEVSEDGGESWRRIATMYDGEGPGRPTRDLECGLALQTDGGAIIYVYRDFENYHWRWDEETGEAVDPRLTVWSIRSLDAGRTWIDRQMIFDGYCGALNDIMQASDGTVVVPVQRYVPEPGRHCQAVYTSADDGATWRESNVIDIGGHGHHDGIFEGTVTELSDGSLLMLMRTPLDRLYRARSTDGGLTWRDVEPTRIPASNAPGFVLRLASGRHVLAWNPLSPGRQMRDLDELTPPEQRRGWGTLIPCDGWRNSLLIVVSEDDCETWSEPIELARGPRLCYPQIREVEPGRLWVSFVAGREWTRTVVEVDEQRLVDSPPAQAEAEGEPFTIVALGSSTTAPRGGVLVYATQLEWVLTDEGRAVEVINAGVGSDTTERARERFAGDVLAREPELTIIQLGINDAAVDVWRDATEPRVAIDRYEENLAYFVEELTARGGDVILMTPNPLRWAQRTRELYDGPPYDLDDPDGFNVVLRDYAGRVRAVAERTGVRLVDTFAAFEAHGRVEGQSVDDLLLDGMHPNTAGHTLETDLLLVHVRAIMARRAAAESWDLDALMQPPRTWPAEGFEEEGVEAVFYEALPWRGEPTRTFAWVGVPELPESEQAPGMVLVHGGGGTAFADWVRMWTERGYAAIAMDTCGGVPGGEPGDRPRHEHGGPPGSGGWEQMDMPREDQWTRHAVADVLLAHSLLASDPRVDAERIGVTGISWGGYLTSIVAGVDLRLKVAVPVYGCGAYEQTGFSDRLDHLTQQQRERWVRWWDPLTYLPAAELPMLWVTGTNDFAYWLPALQASYTAAPGPHTLAVRVAMPHGHDPGQRPEEIAAFADSILRDGPPLPRIIQRDGEPGDVAYEVDAPRPLARAELVFTRQEGAWPEREWETLPARIDGDTITAGVPEDAVMCYVNVVDERGLLVSSEHRAAP